jgi:hypothetical protein
MAHKRKHRDKRTFATRVPTLTERVCASGSVRSAWVTPERIPAKGRAYVFGERRTMA